MLKDCKSSRYLPTRQAGIEKGILGEERQHSNKCFIFNTNYQRPLKAENYGQI